MDHYKAHLGSTRSKDSWEGISEAHSLKKKKWIMYVSVD